MKNVKAKVGTSARAGRPKDMEKRAAILHAAGELFMAQGFDGTSMDAIAQSAGVSKLTLYSHFEDKEDLFRACIVEKCQEHTPEDVFRDFGTLEVREALMRLATGFVRLILSDEVIRLERTIITETRHPSKMGALFYDAGPRRMLEGFEACLRGLDAAGALRVPDPVVAAGQFFAMLKGKPHMQRLLNLKPAPTRADIERHVEGAVETFLRAYAPAHRAESA